ncbi:MAG: 2-dehydropantoate 2-reductase N-terminal domain-containing protein, partial [Planctomycetota bacterium]|nr:2-dehydropantoate 2-reductase N-terminal domain-containing protein [Planctomycetota bacterium]
AVGVVYGRHLQKAGAKLSFYVREKYREQCEKGLTVYPLNEDRSFKAVDFQGFDVLTTPEDVAKHKFDQVWLAVPSTALYVSDFLEPFLKACGDATIVSLTPGLEDREHMLKFVPESKLCWGLITFISYQAPLPGETLDKEGIAYWFPPLSKNPFSGPKEITKGFVAALNKGGCPAKYLKNAATASAMPSSMLMPHLVALQGANWSFQELKKSELLGIASKAAKEAMVISGKKVGKCPWYRGAVCPLTLRMIMGMAPRLIPFDIEVYLKYHFTKVNDQTRMYIDTYLKYGEEYGVETKNIRLLKERVLTEKASS